jgi:hypothetical protein
MLPRRTIPIATRSDTRLKTDIVRVGQLENGLSLYRFRYLWSKEVLVGVLAQEVWPVAPYAVILGEDGFLRVNYALLGTRMMTWDEWRKSPIRDGAEDADPSVAELRLSGIDLLGL